VRDGLVESDITQTATAGIYTNGASHAAPVGRAPDAVQEKGL
jgi:hypothetical protein